ncbi:uncharacterized protein RJT20DRAFT_17527 [Scheffersomyces xylosifermentans]|uniref:uncharacterized protein n=1 Tax=Scheffersomyces xylosifermentans TaxID=1304137 RepID=UPI00315DC9C1
MSSMCSIRSGDLISVVIFISLVVIFSSIYLYVIFLYICSLYLYLFIISGFCSSLRIFPLLPKKKCQKEFVLSCYSVVTGIFYYYYHYYCYYCYYNSSFYYCYKAV